MSATKKDELAHDLVLKAMELLKAAAELDSSRVKFDACGNVLKAYMWVGKEHADKLAS